MILASDDADDVARQPQKAQVWIDPVVRQRADNDIELAKAQAADQLVRKTGIHGEADIRMPVHDARNRHRQMPAQPGRTSADARVTPFSICNPNHLGSRVGKLRFDQLGVPDESPASFGEFDPPPAPVIKPRSERPLQPVHALRQAGLGDVHRLRGLAQVEPLGDGEKKLKLTMIHDMSSQSYFRILSVNCRVRIKGVTIASVRACACTRHRQNKLTDISAAGIYREGDMRIGRRSVLKRSRRQLLDHRPRSGAFAQASGPSDASQIDVAKAKAEGKVVLYTSLDTQIVDAIIAPFKEKYGINVEYFRGGAADVSSKVLAEADAGRTQVDMVDASDLAALLLMKERKLLKRSSRNRSKRSPPNCAIRMAPGSLTA